MATRYEQQTIFEKGDKVRLKIVCAFISSSFPINIKSYMIKELSIRDFFGIIERKEDFLVKEMEKEKVEPCYRVIIPGIGNYWVAQSLMKHDTNTD